MRVLIVWGSKRGGTEGIARMIGDAIGDLRTHVELRPAKNVRGVDAFDAVIVGGAVYANRWHRDARRFVTRNLLGLRRVPVWFFSSGPLDASADASEIAPLQQVAVLMERIGARGHATGGRLAPDATGFPASAMAKTSSGDWRNPERIRAWATSVAKDLPSARPRPAIEPPAHAPIRLIVPALVASAICGALAWWPVVHVMAAPLVFALFAIAYFRARGARDPLPSALAFAGILAVVELGLRGTLAPSAAWIAVPLAFVTVWIVGVVYAIVLPLRQQFDSGHLAR